MSALLCEGPVHISSGGSCPQHHPWQATTGHIFSSRTSLSTHNVVTLLEFCLKSTLFTFCGKYYEHVHSAAMGSPINLLVANLFMEDFEARAINSTSNSPSISLRYVDYTFVIHKAEYTQQFLVHQNSLNPHIQFTAEAPSEQGSLHSWTH